MKTVGYKDFEIIATGHAGFIVRSESLGVSLAFDPYDISGEFAGVDYVFISHPHFDHCDPNSIKKLITPKTKIVAPTSCREELSVFQSQVDHYQQGDKVSLGPLKYWGIPAYNLDKFRTPNEVFHPMELGGVGFVVEIDNTRFYHAGDTDKVEEMAQLKKIDVAFLPISGTFVMTIDEAIDAAKMINAKLTIPMHFGKLLGSVAEANRFQNLLKDTLEVKVLSIEDH